MLWLFSHLPLHFVIESYFKSKWMDCSMEVLCIFLPFHASSFLTTQFPSPEIPCNLSHLPDLTFLFRDQSKSWFFGEALTICWSHKEISLGNVAILASGICCLEWNILFSLPMWRRSSFTELGFISISRAALDSGIICTLGAHMCLKFKIFCFTEYMWLVSVCFLFWTGLHMHNSLYTLNYIILVLFTLNSVYNEVSLTLGILFYFPVCCIAYAYGLYMCVYICRRSHMCSCLSRTQVEVGCLSWISHHLYFLRLYLTEPVRFGWVDWPMSLRNLLVSSPPSHQG